MLGMLAYQPNRHSLCGGREAGGKRLYLYIVKIGNFTPVLMSFLELTFPKTQFPPSLRHPLVILFCTSAKEGKSTTENIFIVNQFLNSPLAGLFEHKKK